MNEPGHPTALSPNDEQLLVKKVIDAAKWGFPFSRYKIQLVVKAFLDKKSCWSKSNIIDFIPFLFIKKKPLVFSGAGVFSKDTKNV